LLDERIPINDANALRDFAAQRVAVWVFEYGPSSPEVPPFDESISEAPPPTHSSKRSSAQQRSFRDAVLRRDGNACVLCGLADAKGSMSVLEAAHVIAARSPQEVLDGASLLNVFDTNNGVTLCGDCHTWFDKHMWCVRADNTVVVADALRMREGCGRWAGLHGRTLRVPTDPSYLAVWPPFRHWEVQERLFEAEAVARHETVADRPFRCDKCDARYKTEVDPRRHKCVMGRHVYTPIFARAFPAAAAAASAGGGRVLDFIEVGEGGGDESDASEE